MSGYRLLPHPWADILSRVEGRLNLKDQSALERTPEVVKTNKRLIETGNSPENAEVAVLWDSASRSAGGQAWRAVQHKVGDVRADGTFFEDIEFIGVPPHCDPNWCYARKQNPAIPALEDILSRNVRHETKDEVSKHVQKEVDGYHRRVSDAKAAISEDASHVAEGMVKSVIDGDPTGPPISVAMPVNPLADPEKEEAEELPALKIDLAVRLKEVLLANGVSDRDFAVDRGVSNATVSNWFKRGVPAARIEEIEAYVAAHEPHPVEA